VAKILLVPDSFKGSATSGEVADSVAKGWVQVRSADEITRIAFADGGEGTLAAIESAVDGSVRVPVVAQSGDGRDRDCYWLLVKGDIAVIEMAMICGITTVEKLDAMGAHSFGLGQVIAAAACDARVKEILVAVGGSASTDAGVGALMALGFKCVAENGASVALGGGALIDLKKITGDFVAPARGIKILVDVQSPMTGIDGAAHVFGPQKGASPADVELLDLGLKNFLDVVGGVDAPGYGAAGGVSGGLALVLGAQIVSGVQALAEITGVIDQISQVDCVITGEGAFDNQSFQGKVVGYLLGQAAARGVPAMVVCGVNKNGDDERVISLVELAPSVEAAMTESTRWLEEAGKVLAARFSAIPR
jgi:glycerate kinase